MPLTRMCLLVGFVIFPLVHVFSGEVISALQGYTPLQQAEFFIFIFIGSIGFAYGCSLGIASAMAVQMWNEGNGTLARVLCFIAGAIGIGALGCLCGFNLQACLAGFPYLMLPLAWSILLIFFSVFSRGWGWVK